MGGLGFMIFTRQHFAYKLQLAREVSLPLKSSALFQVLHSYQQDHYVCFYSNSFGKRKSLPSMPVSTFSVFIHLGLTVSSSTRRRKMVSINLGIYCPALDDLVFGKRCDGAKPACGQCIRADRSEDCEYTDGPGPTQTQMLEQEVDRLQGRIAELENSTASPLTLHDPYANFHSTSQALSQPGSLSVADAKELYVMVDLLFILN